MPLCPSKVDTKLVAPLLNALATRLIGGPVGDALVKVRTEESWDGSIKGHLGDYPSADHTLNNFGDRQLRYRLRIHSTGYALLNLGLPPRSSLRLRLFGERDHTQKNQSYIAGTIEVRLTSEPRKRAG